MLWQFVPSLFQLIHGSNRWEQKKAVGRSERDTVLWPHTSYRREIFASIRCKYVQSSKRCKKTHVCIWCVHAMQLLHFAFNSTQPRTTTHVPNFISTKPEAFERSSFAQSNKERRLVWYTYIYSSYRKCTSISLDRNNDSVSSNLQRDRPMTLKERNWTDGIKCKSSGIDPSVLLHSTGSRHSTFADGSQGEVMKTVKMTQNWSKSHTEWHGNFVVINAAYLILIAVQQWVWENWQRAYLNMLRVALLHYCRILIMSAVFGRCFIKHVCWKQIVVMCTHMTKSDPVHAEYVHVW
jgi:hypothetical protein